MIRDADKITVTGVLQEDGQIRPDEPLPMAPGPVEVTVRPMQSAEGAPKAPRSIFDMAGVGAEMWQKIDVDQYLQDLRDEWERGPQ